jgi:hypothetical protein
MELLKNSILVVSLWAIGVIVLLGFLGLEG